LTVLIHSKGHAIERNSFMSRQSFYSRQKSKVLKKKNLIVLIHSKGHAIERIVFRIRGDTAVMPLYLSSNLRMIISPQKELWNLAIFTGSYSKLILPGAIFYY
jgi:butyrate kinase